MDNEGTHRTGIDPELQLKNLRAIAQCYRWLEENAANRKTRTAFAEQAAHFEEQARRFEEASEK